MTENKKEGLFTDFPEISTNAWEEKIKADLKGADYEKKLVWRTIEGFNVNPYYREEDLKGLEYLDGSPGKFPYVRGNRKYNNDWEIRQDIRVDDAKEANKKALFILDRGITSLGFTLPNDVNLTEESFKELLNDIFFECIHLNFNAGNQAPEVVEFLLNQIALKNIDKDRILGSVDFDPLGQITQTGGTYTSLDEDLNRVKALIQRVQQPLPHYRVLNINASNFSNAGASIVQELGMGLSQAVEYLNLLTDKGLTVDEITPHMQFVFGVGSNYFMEIAKLRAARLLWSHIIQSYKPNHDETARMYIHSVTSNWNKTIYDPYVNMLRVTTESMSAVIGGTNSLYVKPFDSVFRDVSKFSGRIARNTQIILKEEAYFDKIVDPSAGSYYIENLTASIAGQAWKVFLEMEDKGGFIEAMKSGSAHKMLLDTTSKRDRNIATRREIFVGTNQYPNGAEKISDQINEEVAFQEIKTADNAIAEPFCTYRGTMPFERLRLATEKHSFQPKVFMLTIGSLAWRKARAGFASGFFACAGYEILDNLGFETPDDGVKAAMDAKADIVVICSSDEEYKELAPEIHEKLKGKAQIVVAGAPACMDELKSKGIEHFIHMKSNVLETLQQFHQLLGIK